MGNTVVIDMLAALNELEAALQAVGWWQDAAPDAAALRSSEPFCVDTLTFSEWLQWVYVPKMRSFIVTHGRLPTSSGLLAMAEEAWRDCTEDSAPLLVLMARLDCLVNGCGGDVG